MYLGWTLVTETMNSQKEQIEDWNVSEIFLQAVMGKRRLSTPPLGIPVSLTLCGHLGSMASCELWAHLSLAFASLSPFPLLLRSSSCFCKLSSVASHPPGLLKCDSPEPLFLSSCICSPPLLIDLLLVLRDSERKWFQQLNSFYSEGIFKYAQFAWLPFTSCYDQRLMETIWGSFCCTDQKTFRNEGQDLVNTVSHLLPQKIYSFKRVEIFFIRAPFWRVAPCSIFIPTLGKTPAKIEAVVNIYHF